MKSKTENLIQRLVMPESQQDLTHEEPSELTPKQQKQKARRQEFKQSYLNQTHILQGKNFISKLLFFWISSLLKFGSMFPIETSTLPQLPDNMKPSIEYDSLYSELSTCKKSKREGVTLLLAIGKSYRKRLVILTFLALLITALAMYAPVLTHKIIKYVEIDKESRATSEGVWLILGVAAITLGRAVCQSHLYYHFAVLGFNLSNTLSLLIFTKALKHPVLCQKKYSISEIINYSQIDAQRMTNMGYQLTALLFTPLQIIVGVGLMYSFIGISFLSGMATMIITIGLTFLITKKIASINQKTLKAKDARVKLTQEILDIIRFIKVNAIQKYFFRRLNQKRDAQLKLNRKRGFLEVLIVFLFWLSCPLILSATFLTYLWLGNQITATVAFTTIMIFNILQSPMRQFPSAFSSLLQMYTSVKRIQRFLFDKQMNYRHHIWITEDQSNTAIRIQNGTFRWGVEEQKKDNAQVQRKDEEDTSGFSPGKFKRPKIHELSQETLNESLLEDHQDFDKQKSMASSEISTEEVESEDQQKDEHKIEYLSALKRITTTISKRKFTMVIGDIGSGKSSLLLAILNQMKSSKHSLISIDGEIAYAAQKPWIMCGTVKDNITFTLPFDKKKFDEIVHYASLKKDLQILVKAEETQIGEKGVNLSGGQKARIGLARALYSNADILLLDDVISAVDVHVGEFLIKQTILKYLRNKTVLMPTHAVKFAEFADQIIVLKKGTIARKGAFNDICNTPQFQEVYQQSLQKKEQNNKTQEQQKIAKEQKSFKQNTKKIRDEKKLEKLNKSMSVKKSFADKAVEELIIPEDHKKGSISLQVWKEYIRSNGGAWFVVLVLFSMSAWLGLSLWSNIEMKDWCSSNPRQNYHLYVYLFLSILSSVFAFIRAYVLVISGFKQGEKIHKKIIKSLLYASIGDFYGRVPVGRILNRLTKDLRELDQTIGYGLGQFLTNLFSLIGTLSICIYASTPFVIIPIIIVGYFCNRLRGYYMSTQREVIRVEATSSSPIVSGFVASINGVATIRAFRVQEKFLEYQMEKIEVNKRARITRQALESWFATRLTFLSFCVNMFAIGFCLLSSNQNSSLAGLLLSYALNLSDDIISLTFSWANLQTRMISVERIFNFMQIQPQKPYQEYCMKWRTKQQGYKQVGKQGEIQFKDVGVKYRPDLPYVLRHVSFKVKSGMKVGIVGRTGAGKSTIISTLLRLVDPIQGQILIDGTPAKDYFIKDLRHSITMIDQEPTLIKSTFRQNLDPTHAYSDSQLEQLLKECNIWQSIKEKQGLDGQVNNESLSAGEKQLLCICRAMLKRSKIVLIDEATANIDVKNDELIQNVIQTKFAASTVITIAHRLTTLKNSDMILVMGEGRVRQYGSPSELQNKEDGIYAEMCRRNTAEFLV